MNPTISTTLAAGLLALAAPALAVPYTMAPYSPVSGPVPMCAAPAVAVPAWQPAPLRPVYGLTFDAHAFYGFRAVPHSRYATDIGGGELEVGYHVSPRQAFTLTMSYGLGGDDRTNYVETEHGPCPVSEDYRRGDFNLLLGYRFTQPLTERTSLSFGLKGGLDVQTLSYDNYWHGRGHWDHGRRCHCDADDDRDSETTCGFAYAASVMLETKINEHWSVMFGYQFRGATTEPDAPPMVPGGELGKARSMRWHEVHIGVRASF